MDSGWCLCHDLLKRPFKTQACKLQTQAADLCIVRSKTKCSQLLCCESCFLPLTLWKLMVILMQSTDISDSRWFQLMNYFILLTFLFFGWWHHHPPGYVLHTCLCSLHPLCPVSCWVVLILHVVSHICFVLCIPLLL